jgi:glycerol-3-phosphate acyltransferase PlsX
VGLGGAPASVVVALDALGGDRAPAEPVRGALAAAGPSLRVILVGDEPAIRAEIAAQGGEGTPGIEIEHAPERIASEEDGARAVRSKPNSSLVRACRLVAEGRAGAFCSAGHSGAMLAAATLHLRRVPGVMRPGIAVVVPSRRGPVVIIDAGASADSRPEHLPQFALMGFLLAQDVLDIRAPRVGLLSIGEEAGKGSELVQAAFAAMRDAPGFVGNVEGRDIPAGTVDVVVTDGFTGNVALKLYEGAAEAIFGEVRRSLTASRRGRLAGALARPALRGLRARFDPDEYGGAYLLGVRGLAVYAHGSSSGRAIANALRMGARGAREGLVAQLEAGLAAGRARVG